MAAPCAGTEACAEADVDGKEGGLVAFDFEVFGKVQGVFFRKHTKRFADKNGLRGWCQNTGAGTVVGQAEGNPAAVADFKRWLSQTGSPKSRVERAEFREERDGAEPRFDGFRIVR